MLFVFHFSGNKKVDAGGDPGTAMMANPGDISIAYFNMDSVMSQWNLYDEYQQDLQTYRESSSSDRSTIGDILRAQQEAAAARDKEAEE